jgi:MarR family transcriptional regulator, organic hydroperoxide resistance regulator
VNSSSQEQFEDLYGRIWTALHRPDDPDVSQHERQFLHHIPLHGSASLTELARHLALPKSSASVVVKGLARRGFLTRERELQDERRLRIELTPAGRARVQADTVLEPGLLAAALDRLPARERRALLSSLGSLAQAAEAVAAEAHVGDRAGRHAGD